MKIVLTVLTKVLGTIDRHIDRAKETGKIDNNVSKSVSIILRYNAVIIDTYEMTMIVLFVCTYMVFLIVMETQPHR